MLNGVVAWSGNFSVETSIENVLASDGDCSDATNLMSTV